jgi:hypothetical protein
VQSSTVTAILTGYGLRIEAFWRDDSKTGKFVARDSAADRASGCGSSRSHNALTQMSADGVWLMTVASMAAR